jgi:hypothetical protein
MGEGKYGGGIYIYGGGGTGIILLIMPKNFNKYINSFSSAAEITRAKPTWYFAGSYLPFSACYVDENNTIRFSEKFPIDTYNKMSTL